MSERRRIGFSLYLITDRRLMKVPLYEGIEAALRGGVRAVQLREKDLSVKDLYRAACRLRSLTSRHGARLFVNDRLDVAIAAGADGVHLGGKSIPLRAVRKVAGKGMLVGVSTHSLEEAIDAERDGADFITFGPVYETPSKMRYGPPAGIEKLREVTSRVKIPVFAIGGVQPARVQDVARAGAGGVALISAVLSSDDIERAAARLTASVERALTEPPSSCSRP